MIEVTSISQLKNLLEQNAKNRIFFFKHSTRCPVSSMAFAHFERFAKQNQPIVCAFIKLIEYRDVSNFLEELSRIVHQSPQVIQFDKGQPVWHASHSGIHEDALCSRMTESL